MHGFFRKLILTSCTPGMRFSAVLLSLLCACFVAAGQTGTILTGTVQDPTGAVIPDARIGILSPDGVVVAHGVTNGAGLFRLAVPQSGQYILDVVEPGFREFRRPIAVKAG